MKPHLKSAFTLILMTPFLTELLSGNIPAPNFFRPFTFLFMTVAYGLPVIVIREISVRLKFSLCAIILLGLAYGILNEGIFAKTLLLKTHIPIDTFDNYGFFRGINFSWAAIITTWHAFHSGKSVLVFTAATFEVIFILAILKVKKISQGTAQAE